MKKGAKIILWLALPVLYLLGVAFAAWYNKRPHVVGTGLEGNIWKSWFGLRTAKSA